MAQSFGARLRQQRERQQIALTSIAEQTKISLSLLEELECDNLSHWPAGIFRRSFIRAYAQSIRLEPDAVVREFLEIYPDPAEGSAAALPGVDRQSAGQRPPTRLECLVAATIRYLPRLRPSAVQEPSVQLSQEEAVQAALRAQEEAVHRAQEQAVKRARAQAVQRAQEQALALQRAQEEARQRAQEEARQRAQEEALQRDQEEALQRAREEPLLGVQEAFVQHLQESGPAGGPVAELAAVDPGPARTTVLPDVELSAIAHLCTELAVVLEIRDVEPLLERAGRILDAVGLVVWVWDPQATALKPALAYGYPDEVVARLPRVRRDTDNATAESFRSGQTRIVNGSDLASGAVVVPLLTPTGCGGVLAVELRQGGEQRESVRALATIFAAQLATFVGAVPLAHAANA
jgi:cytoskeletal protein RodZ